MQGHIEKVAWESEQQKGARKVASLRAQKEVIARALFLGFSTKYDSQETAGYFHRNQN